jgi:hypothetical protein
MFLEPAGQMNEFWKFGPRLGGPCDRVTEGLQQFRALDVTSPGSRASAWPEAFPVRLAGGSATMSPSWKRWFLAGLATLTLTPGMLQAAPPTTAAPVAVTPRADVPQGALEVPLEAACLPPEPADRAASDQPAP